MPVVKIPVQHKFGIVSLSRAEQLLARSSHRKEQKTKFRSVSSPPSHEVNQAFIIKYNSAVESEREVLDTVIIRALQHAKYKAGLRSKGHVPSNPTLLASDHVTDVDVSRAWLELTLLCQCYGQHQQDVLVTLAASLNHAPLSTAHIASLFYIAGLCYQWLKSDVLSNDLLRSGELLLLQILHLVSMRILYHHLTGALIDGCTRDEVRQFKFDLEGFENRERTYRNFPEALLHWKFALEIGLLVCEAYSKPSHQHLVGSPTQATNSSAHCNDVATANTETEEQGIDQSEPRVVSAESKTQPLSTTTEGHADIGLSPVLWHALDIWQCTKQGYESLQEAIEDLLSCSTEFDADNWIEGMLAMNVLCTASETITDVLHLVQSLASGSAKQHYLSDNGESPANQHTSTSKLSRECSAKHSSMTTPTETKEDMTRDAKKGTRFTLPSSAEKRISHDGKRWNRQDSGKDSSHDMKSMKTLNILGMQPDFNESLVDSSGRTPTCSGTTDYNVPTSSVLKQSLGDNLKPQEVHIDQASDSEILLRSVRTQSLIENESIPDVPPSQYSSNTTVLEIGSCTTLEAALSNCKSVGLLASSNSCSKNLDLCASNELSTTISNGHHSGNIPAGREEIDNSTSSLIPVQRKLVSPVSGLLADYGLPVKPIYNNDNELSTLHEVACSHSSHHHAEDKETPHVDAIHPQGRESRYTHYTHSTAPLSGGAGVAGSEVPPSTIYRRSTLSTPATELPYIESSAILGTTSKFENWPNEVALVYTLNMASIVIYGRSSLIQKIALEGLEQKSPHSQKLPCQQKYGLMQLVDFSEEMRSETDSSKCSFNSWSIRHCAVLGLSRVCRVCSNLSMKDGLSEVAWSKLIERHSAENDARVIEAYKISKVCSDLDQPLLVTEKWPCSSPLFAHIADGLSKLFLPPITPAPEAFRLPKKIAKGNTRPTAKVECDSSNIKNVRPKVVTHFELNRAAAIDNFTSRTIGALNKIAEEHWKRQMKQEEEEEKLEQQKEGQRLKKEHEAKMKKKAEKLANRKPKHQ